MMQKYDEALSKAMKYCSTKEVCAFDIKQKLVGWEVDVCFHHKIIKHLISEKFIDEQRYANSFVSDKFRFNDYGKIKLRFELKLKKIDEAYINEALQKIDDKEYIEKIEKLVSDKLKGIKEKDFYKLKAKLYRYLSSKGFEKEIFSKILDERIKSYFGKK